MSYRYMLASLLGDLKTSRARMVDDLLVSAYDDEAVQRLATLQMTIQAVEAVDEEHRLSLESDGKA